MVLCVQYDLVESNLCDISEMDACDGIVYYYFFFQAEKMINTPAQGQCG